MRMVATRIALCVVLLGTQFSCTHAVALKDPAHSHLDGSGQKSYRIEMKTGEVHVVREFELDGDELLVTKFDRHSGTYDPDQEPVPSPPFSIPTAKIDRIDEIRSDERMTALAMVLVAAGVVGFFVLLGSYSVSTGS